MFLFLFWWWWRLSTLSVLEFGGMFFIVCLNAGTSRMEFQSGSSRSIQNISCSIFYNRDMCSDFDFEMYHKSVLISPGPTPSMQNLHDTHQENPQKLSRLCTLK